MNTQSIYQLIRGIHFFDSLSDEHLHQLAEAMTMVDIKGGEYLMKQGEEADGLYILTHGRMLVTVKDPKDGEVKVGEIGVGDIVGEMALLTDLPRSATVRAVRDCSLVKIDHPLFKSIIKEYTQAAMGIVSECVKRLLPSFSEKKHGVKAICLVPCSASVDMQSFSSDLVAALSKYIKVKVINASDPDLQLCMKQDQSAVMQWLAENEHHHDMVVYVAEDNLNDFTRLAISQSDKILMVALPQKELNSLISTYINQPNIILADKYLIVVHAASTKFPQGTQVILASIHCDEHFHVKQKSDYERVARYMLGRTVSVVFSGGGLRGIAHQGLVAALQDRGIPIDMVAGTSFGALPAVLLAMGYSPEEMLEHWKLVIEKIKNVVDITLPLAALSKGEVLFELLSEVMPPEVTMEDLWLPAFCVSTNIANFSTHMHRSGPAWEAVRASLSIPGIFPPVIRGTDVFVDGASMNNLPVDLMATINNQGTIIAAVASGKPGRKDYVGYSQGLSGWRMLPDMLSHGGHPLVPSIIETMLAASLSASTFHQEKMCTVADYVFDLGVDHFGLLDAVHWNEIRDMGYNNAIKIIDQYQLTPQKLGV